MSMRTLIELNHDYSDRLVSAEFAALLNRYLASGARTDAEALRRFGALVIGLRHHSDNWIIDANSDGFPPRYLTPASVDRSGEAGETTKIGSAEGESAVAAEERTDAQPLAPSHGS
jgi:hypothetical protein